MNGGGGGGARERTNNEERCRGEKQPQLTYPFIANSIALGKAMAQAGNKGITVDTAVDSSNNKVSSQRGEGDTTTDNVGHTTQQ